MNARTVLSPRRPGRDARAFPILPILVLLAASRAAAQTEPAAPSPAAPAAGEASALDFFLGAEATTETLIAAGARVAALSAEDLARLFDPAPPAEGDAGAAETTARRVGAIRFLRKAAEEQDARPVAGTEAVAAAFAHPSGDLAGEAMALAGAWGVEAARARLAELAGAEEGDTPRLRGAVEGLALLGGDESVAALQTLASRDRGLKVRARAVAALARIDPAAAGLLAAEFLTDPDFANALVEDCSPWEPILGDMVRAFLDRDGGGQAFAVSVASAEVVANGSWALPLDAANAGLGALLGAGRRDAPVFAELRKPVVAGPEGPAFGTHAADAPAVAELIAAVAGGDPAAGANHFARRSRACVVCHAEAAGPGAIGPSIEEMRGLPVERIVAAILRPDEIPGARPSSRIRTDRGRIVRGTVVHEDAERIVVQPPGAAPVAIPIARIAERADGASIMPDLYGELFSADALRDLAAYIARGLPPAETPPEAPAPPEPNTEEPQP